MDERLSRWLPELQLYFDRIAEKLSSRVEFVVRVRPSLESED